MGRNFSSDHIAPACDAIMAAVNAANLGAATSYGGDDLTARLQSIASRAFETEVSIFPVSTGTAANALALSQLVPAFGSVYCYEAAHIVTDDEWPLFTGAADGFPPDKRHASQRPKPLIAENWAPPPLGASADQATEWGTVYARRSPSSAQSRAPCDTIHGRRVLPMPWRTWPAAPPSDGNVCRRVYSGHRRNGAPGAEAVVFFDPGWRLILSGGVNAPASDVEGVSERSDCVPGDGLWLYARHANAMGAEVGARLEVGEAQRLHLVQVNELFVALPEQTILALASGFGLSLAVRGRIGRDNRPALLRTVIADVDEFIAAERSRPPLSEAEAW